MHRNTWAQKLESRKAAETKAGRRGQTPPHKRGVPRPSAGLAARGLAALQVVEVHVHLPRNLDRHLRVAAAEAAADGVGDDAEALPEPDGGEGE